MHEVEARMLDQQPTLVMRGQLTTADIPAFLTLAYGAVMAHAGRDGVQPIGPPFARYRALDDEFREFEIEAGFPVAAELEGSGDVEASMLPGGAAAVVLHVGPYDAMRPAYDAVMSWISDQGGAPAGSPWEVYYSDPNEQPDPSTWRTEIVQPYRVA